MKQAHVYIYGVIDNWQDESASDWGYVNLKSVKNQIDNQSDFDEIVLHVHSDGGVVTEGFAIHDYLKTLGKPIKTLIEGNCYSIATVIALAGDTRVMTSNSEFLIHNPWGWAGGEKEDIQKYVDELDKLEEKIADFYASKTNISKDEALELMKVETTFTPEEALEKGFITEIAQVMRAVALYRKPEKQKPNNNMSKDTLTKDEAKKMFSGLQKTIDTVMNLLKGKEAKALVLQDANGDDVDFYELEDDATPTVGDKAKIDGADADGEVVMPSGETYVFEAGELKEIKPAEDETDEEDSEEMQNLKSENETLKNKVNDLEAKNTELENVNSKALKQIEDVALEVKNLKENISSDFDYDPDIDGNPRNERVGKKRNLFKKED